MAEKNVLGILGGGGPAPGLNAVLCAAALYALDQGWEVIGIRNGFKHLIKGKPVVQHLTPKDVSRLHNLGGFYLGLARDTPAYDAGYMEHTIQNLKSLGITHLIGIGGDDTNTSMAHLSAKSDFACVGVPKTIDNDMNVMGPDMPTFGFQTAVHYGDLYAQNYQNDGKSSGRWYFLIVMGRKAGFITLGVTNTVSATLGIIPEEIPKNAPLKLLVDLVAGSIIKRASQGKNHGLCLVGEGVIERVRERDIEGLEGVERDPNGHIRYAEVPFAKLLRTKVSEALAKLEVKHGITAENLGYILRCNPPTGFDKEYCRKLGWGAIDYFMRGGRGAIITIKEGRIVPKPFEKAMDKNGRIKTRKVDLNSVDYRMSQTYQVRLIREDFEDEDKLKKLAKTTNLSPEAFRDRFGYLAGIGLKPGRPKYAWNLE